MTVSVNSRRRNYAGNGVTTVFTGPLAYFSSRIQVYKTVSGVKTLVPDTDYIVDRLRDSKGVRVAMNIAPASGVGIEIVSVVPYTQETDITNQGAFNADVIEKGMDELEMQIQQLNDNMRNSAKIPDPSLPTPGDIFPLTPLAPVVINADGTGFGVGNFELSGDMLLRPSLATPSGAALIGYSNAGSGVPGSDLKSYLDAIPANIQFAQYATNKFWPAYQPGARIQRLNDRVFIGSATTNDGNTGGAQVTKDWLEAERVATTNNSQLAVLSTIGQTAFLAGSKSSDWPGVDGMGCIGGNFWAINDNTTAVQTVYGIYGEARRKPFAGRTHVMELDIVNSGAEVMMSPYNMFPQGLTAATWIASGGEFGGNPASVAMAVVNNGATFKKGILFGSGSLDAQGVAIEMARTHAIQWQLSDGVIGAQLKSDVTNVAATSKINFSDIGVLVRNRNDANMLRVAVDQTFVNGITISPAVSGTGPTVFADGADTNVDLRLSGKGTGMVDFRGLSVVGSAGTQVGYVTIKFGGTPLKVPIYNL